eukprot:CAMPEP_0206490880 /NCGR_PEP_ID=MMETSP0324_2-20121206/44472_1 /ASSEMBLY_ACC=CAM_ASM_000836 /TAXON_ID=2866 /ORGANISM="Crypthecodinium cohnii, Strain Seligo" /LENGTH=173 /DNA_ID=CAMNT_0053971581 /DNA_START=1032 /DNA_END=1553 /DNA_ORIENTATION=+
MKSYATGDLVIHATDHLGEVGKRHADIAGPICMRRFRCYNSLHELAAVLAGYDLYLWMVPRQSAKFNCSNSQNLARGVRTLRCADVEPVAPKRALREPVGAVHLHLDGLCNQGGVGSLQVQRPPLYHFISSGRGHARKEKTVGLRKIYHLDARLSNSVCPDQIDAVEERNELM